MPLETATWPDDLVPANPVGATDPVAEGDDHLRMLKQVTQNWAGTWGGDALDTQAKAYADAGDATVQAGVDANTAAIALKADLNGAALTSCTIDGADPVTDVNYVALPVAFATTSVMPADSGKFLPTGNDVTLSGTPVDGNRLDVFNNSVGDITISGGTFTGLGQSGAITITVPSRYGVSLIRQGSTWFVIGTAST